MFTMAEANDRSRRLGRGLGALITPSGPPSASPQTEPADSQDPVRKISVSLIDPNPLQPRREFAAAELNELKESLRSNGLLQPVTVRARTDGRFELIAGERRLRAAKALEWDTIPAFVRDATNEQMLSLALVENLQRADLNPVEEAEGYRQLTTEFGLAHQDVARAVGKERSTITNALRLLALPPDVLQLLRSGDISVGHARALLTLAEPETIRSTAQRIVQERLTVRDIERLGQESRPATRRPRGPTRTASSDLAEANRIADSLRRYLQTDVSVQADQNARGEVRIRFYSAEDLERLLDLIIGRERHAD